MVNTGLPSRDCETCRQRRVKCDLVRPSCRRCQKVGRPCGYRDLNNPNIAFHVQTPTTFVNRTGRSRQRLMNKRIEHTSQVPSGPQPKPLLHTKASGRQSDAILYSSNDWTSNPSRGIMEPWDLHIVPLLVNQFSFRAAHGGRTNGSLECLPILLGRAKAETTLYLVAHAVGYIYLANRTNSHESAIVHKSLYGRTLRSLRADLSHPSHQRDDSTLLAVWFSCLYELMRGECDSYGGPMNWDIHSRALGHLLRSRGSQQFQTATGCQLFQIAYHFIQIQSLRSITDPAPESREWLDTIQSRIHTKQLSFVPSFFYGDEVARACWVANSSFQEATSTAGKLAAIDGLVYAYGDLKVSMENPAENGLPLPSENSMYKLQRSQSGQLRIRNHIDACVLRVHTITLDLLFNTIGLTDISEGSAARIAHLQEIISAESQVRGGRILSTLSCLLPGNGTISPSWAESLRVMWPLRMILASPAIESETKQTATLALERIAHEVGIKQAVGSFYPAKSIVINH